MPFTYFFIGEHEFLLKTPAPAEVLPREPAGAGPPSEDGSPEC